MPNPAEMEETQVLGVLIGLAEMVGQLADLGEVLRTVVRVAPRLTGGDRCLVFLHDATAAAFVPVEAYGPQHERLSVMKQIPLREAEVPRLANRVLRQRLPAVVRCPSNEETLPEPYYRAFGIRTMLFIPLIARGEVLGVLAVDTVGQSHHFTSREINLLLGVASQAAMAIENERLAGTMHRLQRRGDALEAVAHDVLLTLDRSLRITAANAAAAELLGWRPEEVVGRPCAEVLRLVTAEGENLCQRECIGLRFLGEGNEGVAETQVSVMTRSGIRVPCRLRATAVRDVNGQVLEILYALQVAPQARLETPVHPAAA